MENNKIDVIVVGAGTAGVSAAVTIARGGKKVLLVDRANNAGEKNMFGGCIYANQTREIFPDFETNAPIERIITQEKIIMLNNEESVDFTYRFKKDNKNASYTVFRSKWDNWCVEEAKKAGVYYAPKTLVKELLYENGKVIGIQTELEKFYCDIVIIADGVNSLLAKQIGLRKDFKDSDVTLNVKEVYKLTPEKLEARYNLTTDEGCACKILSGPFKNVFAMGFMYTNKDTISLGYGISLDELKKMQIKPNELMDKLKNHSSIVPYIKDAELIEYSAHMIPEGSINKIPKVFTNGALVIGDAAGFVNNIHFEGTNLAMLSGKLAGETAIEAINKNDFSESFLSLYYKKLKDSIIFKDLTTHNNTISFLKKHINTITGMYPEFMCEFFKALTLVDGEEKNKVYRKFLMKIIKSGVIFKSIPLGLFAMEKCFKK